MNNNTPRELRVNVTQGDQHLLSKNRSITTNGVQLPTVSLRHHITPALRHPQVLTNADFANLSIIPVPDLGPLTSLCHRHAAIMTRTACMCAPALAHTHPCGRTCA